MNNPASQMVVKRFFEAIDALISARALGGLSTFTNYYGINRRNMQFCRQHPTSNMFQMAWLGYLVNDWHISAHWLLTGYGGMFQTLPPPPKIDVKNMPAPDMLNNPEVIQGK